MEEMENEWGRAAVAGKKVEIDIQLKYTGDNIRPDSFEVRYIIDGIPQQPKVFINQPGG
jgi:hypothetical protein